MALIVAFVVAVVVTPLLARVARRLGVVDQPGPAEGARAAGAVPRRRRRASSRSRSGRRGRAAVAARPARPRARARLADDVATSPPAVRLAGEVGVGVAAAGRRPARGPSDVLAHVAFVLVLLNAVNLLDGLDGLAAGVAAVAGGRVRVVARRRRVRRSRSRSPARSPASSCGTARRRGSTSATPGAISSAPRSRCCSRRVSAPGEPVASSAGSLLFVAVPVADTAVAIVRRARARRPLFAGDRGHVYDQLVDRGWTRRGSRSRASPRKLVLVAIGIGVVHLAGGRGGRRRVRWSSSSWPRFALWTFARPNSWSA